MIHRIANGHIKTLCCWLLLLQMVNLCINPPRHLILINGTPTYAEDLSINTMESVLEVVLEEVFGKDVPETQDAFEIGQVKVCWNVHADQPSFGITCVDVKHAHFPRYTRSIPEWHASSTSPPPKMCVA